uniref:Transcription termination factor 2 n=1 Tax=Oryzias latipes TaxID=8090 RepID=A0A3P9JC95_ORYLA
MEDDAGAGPARRPASQDVWLGEAKPGRRCHVDPGGICMLKTGVKDGPSKGKSFYVCVNEQGCDFSQQSSLPPSHCINHEDSMVELQAISFSQKHQNHRLYYRCVVGKKSGQRWCGSVPWTTQEKENRIPPLNTQLQPSCIPPVRNPFKAPGKMYKDSDWKKMEVAGHKESEKKNMKTSHMTEGGESFRKEIAEKLNTYQGKTLPQGMKIKKRTSGEDSSKADSIEKTTAVITEKTEKKLEGAHNKTSTSSTEVQPDKMNQVSSDVHKSLQTSDKALPGNQTDPPVQRSVTESKPSNSSHASRSPGCVAILDEDSEESRSNRDETYDDVVFVSEKPASQKTTPTSAIQKTITNFPGFQCVAKQGGPKERLNLLSVQLKQKKATLSAINVAALPDKGEKLQIQIKELEDELESLSLSAASHTESVDENRKPDKGTTFSNPFYRQGGSIFLPTPPMPSPPQIQGAGSSLGLQHSQMPAQTHGGDHMQAFYGGRMTYDRLLAVKNATCEAIDHLHKSLESCPDPETEVTDPKGIKVPLMPHQRRALAWLLWRETQKPCGGILADDMGLGKTLTMISLILAKKMKTKEEAKEKDQTKTKLESWVSKSDPTIVASEGTLIICPASLIHHWKKEIDKRVKSCRLTVYLYHGTNRQKSAKVLADHDVVVTTYSLVSKEIQVQTEDANNPSKDPDPEASRSSPLLRVRWTRVILDEAHNIKNPKVQTSMAVCQLRAQARWAITGTPIQNNLLDMYSLLKFLRCSPFDEYKLWKAQVDNGSNRGRERLNILMKALLLRRTKDQLDSTGKPLVSLPNRTCKVHQLHLSEEEQTVYDVVFAQSRSTLQNYLKRHEGKDVGNSSSNPFDKVAQEFGLSQSDSAASSSQQHQQSSSSIHILSLLLRLRQCCCHLSLLKKTLDSSELQGDGIVLSLEEQLNALSLSSSPSPSDADPKDTVLLNGSRFPSRLFEDTNKSTKISAISSELMAIKEKSDDQKSVIVSQWTSMLSIVAVHLRRIGLTFGVIDGSVNPKRRMDLVEEFNTNPKGPQVMLVSLCAGGVGLNLVGGNHLFLIDMHWNPALEDQACDRIYRVGQSRDVTIHKFVCESTVEEKISILQTRKKELAQNVLSGTGNTFSKLSLADLKIIFGV